MKIGLVIEYLPESGKKLGGVSVAVHRLANGLVDAGNEVVVVALNQVPADAIYKEHLPFKSKWLCKALSGYIGQQFYSIFLNLYHFPKADIWHFHGYDHFILKSVGPRVRTLHGSSFREMQATTNTMRKLLMFLNYIWEHITIARCNRVLCIGTETASFFGLKHVVDNPFDPKVFRPSAKSQHPQIFYNGYWTGRK
jgi:hypothetical protein